MRYSIHTAGVFGKRFPLQLFRFPAPVDFKLTLNAERVCRFGAGFPWKDTAPFLKRRFSSLPLAVDARGDHLTAAGQSLPIFRERTASNAGTIG